MAIEEQQTLFDIPENWEEEWKDMPEFIQKNLTPFSQVIISFKSAKDMEDFSKLIGQPVYSTTQSLWFPKAKIDRYSNKRYIDES